MFIATPWATLSQGASDFSKFGRMEQFKSGTGLIGLIWLWLMRVNVRSSRFSKGCHDGIRRYLNLYDHASWQHCRFHGEVPDNKSFSMISFRRGVDFN
jgi:hypothetical protein